MRLRSDQRAVLEMVDDRLEPGQRVPERWEEFPLPLRNRLKDTLLGSRDIDFELGFAEFVNAYLTVYRKTKNGGSGGQGRHREAG